MTKRLISEQTILDAKKRSERIILCEQNSIITDAAKDRAKQLNIKIEIKQDTQLTPVSPPVLPRQSESVKETVAIGSDHSGFALKEILESYLQNLGYKVIDLGTDSDEACDYPDFAYAVAKMVSTGGALKGIMVDSIGIASSIVANKIHGVRAACCFDEYSARSSREYSNANVLTLGGNILGVELAKSITKVWLETHFGGGRHQKRLDKISEIEQKR